MSLNVSLYVTKKETNIGSTVSITVENYFYKIVIHCNCFSQSAYSQILFFQKGLLPGTLYS